MEFEKLVKGRENWHDKYNEDFEAVHEELCNKANKGPVELYDLELGDGVIPFDGNACTCCKTESGLVYIELNVQKENGEAFTHSEILAHLPEGFRPRKDQISSISMTAQTDMNATPTRCPCVVHIGGPNGHITILEENASVGVKYYVVRGTGILYAQD